MMPAKLSKGALGILRFIRHCPPHAVAQLPIRGAAAKWPARIRLTGRHPGSGAALSRDWVIASWWEARPFVRLCARGTAIYRLTPTGGRLLQRLDGR